MLCVLGRQYVEFGTGLALSIPLDAIQARGYYGNWQFTGMDVLWIGRIEGIGSIGKAFAPFPDQFAGILQVLMEEPASGAEAHILGIISESLVVNYISPVIVVLGKIVKKRFVIDPSVIS